MVDLLGPRQLADSNIRNRKQTSSAPGRRPDAARLSRNSASTAACCARCGAYSLKPELPHPHQDGAGRLSSNTENRVRSARAICGACRDWARGLPVWSHQPGSPANHRCALGRGALQVPNAGRCLGCNWSFFTGDPTRDLPPATREAIAPSSPKISYPSSKEKTSGHSALDRMFGEALPSGLVLSSAICDTSSSPP